MDPSIGIGTTTGSADNLNHVTDETTHLADLAKAKDIRENLAKYEQLFGADEDVFVQPTTTRKELWSYYLYYNVRRTHLPHLEQNVH